jgi:hypothetical protein
VPAHLLTAACVNQVPRTSQLPVLHAPRSAKCCPTPAGRNARRDRLSWVDDARHRFVAPSSRRSTPFSAPRHCSHSDRELRCDAADGFQIKLSSAAPATNSQRPAPICPQLCRPTHPAQTAAHIKSAPGGLIEEVRFARDSPLEEAGFEPSVPRKAPGRGVVSASAQLPPSPDEISPRPKRRSRPAVKSH